MNVQLRRKARVHVYAGWVETGRPGPANEGDSPPTQPERGEEGVGDMDSPGGGGREG